MRHPGRTRDDVRPCKSIKSTIPTELLPTYWYRNASTTFPLGDHATWGDNSVGLLTEVSVVRAEPFWLVEAISILASPLGRYRINTNRSPEGEKDTGLSISTRSGMVDLSPIMGML